MIKSMTGFGAGQAENDNYLLTAEIRCVNSKTLDTSLRFPKNISDKELEIRNLLNSLERGKVNLYVEIQTKGDPKPNTSINQNLLKSYYQLLSQTAVELGAGREDIFRLALQMPEVIQTASDDEEKEQIWLLAQQAIRQAVSACEGFRQAEGKSLEGKFENYLDKIAGLLTHVEQQDPVRAENIRHKIQHRLTEIAKDDKFDPNRFEQEIMYYLERLDITEEKVRLKTHLNYFREVMQKEENQGRKLNFIGQEIGREINTIGSKANDAAIQRSVVEMKEELEKIKEQVMNVL
jgi:uncharacterized protein (TIGR00255 family)